MDTISLILLVSSSVNSFILIIALLSKDIITYQVSCFMFYFLGLLRIIIYFIKKLKNKIYNRHNETCENVNADIQYNNFNLVTNRIQKLKNIIDSNESYYVAQREYCEITRLIASFNEDELRNSQKEFLLEILSRKTENMDNLELKR